MANTIAEWVQLVRAEYRESPGLTLTKAQAQRLWGLDPVICDAVLGALVDTGFLRRTANDAFARSDRSH